MPSATISPDKQIKLVTVQPAGAYNTTGLLTNNVDTKGFDVAVIIFNAGTLSANMTLKVQESSDNAASDAYADVTGAAFSAKGTGTDETSYIGVVHLHGRERYLGVHATAAGSGDIAVDVLLMHADDTYLTTTPEFDVK